ncbi:hypothetical protein RCH21_000773 [Arthrobacter sp. PL16]|nr:hypothetical protein [Arthrobacter sp. PL16]
MVPAPDGPRRTAGASIADTVSNFSAIAAIGGMAGIDSNQKTDQSVYL